MQEKKALKTYSFIVFAIMLSKLLGLVRDALMANFYGTGMEAAAFAAASRIPLTIFDITLGTAVAAAFIPVLNEYLEQNDKQKAFAFVNNFLNVILLFALVITALVILFPDTAISLLASGFSGEKSLLAQQILLVLSPIVILASMCYTFVGVLQSLGSFKIPAIMSLLANALMVVYFLTLNDRFGIIGLGVALLIGWVLQLGILLPPLIKSGYRFKFTLSFQDTGLRKSLKMAGPVLISSWVMPINNLITLNIASYFGDFGVPALDYSYKLYFIVSGVFSFAMTNLYFPSLSRLNAAGDRQGAGELLATMLKNVTLIIVVVMAFFMVFSQNIVSVVYQSGAFTSQDVHIVAWALVIYMIGMFGFSWQEILNKFFYSMKNSKTPMIIAIISIAINVVAALALSVPYGIFGIAVGSAISITFGGMALYLILMKKNKDLKQGNTMKIFLIKMLFSFVIIGAVFFGLLKLINLFDLNKIMMILALVICFAIGCGIYLLVLRIFKVQEASQIVSLFLGKVKKEKQQITDENDENIDAN